jgi:hypothetical protein
MVALVLRVHLFECGMQKLFSVHLLRVSAAPPLSDNISHLHSDINWDDDKGK